MMSSSDEDKDGHVDVGQIGRLCKAAGEGSNFTTLMPLAKSVATADGSIDFDGFLAVDL